MHECALTGKFSLYSPGWHGTHDSFAEMTGMYHHLCKVQSWKRMLWYMYVYTSFLSDSFLPSLHDASGLYRQTFLEFVPGVGTVGVSYLTQGILLLPIKWWAEISLLEDLHVWLSHFSWFFGELIQVEIFIPTFECFSFLGEKGSYGWGIEEIFCCSVALHVQNFDFCP